MLRAAHPHVNGWPRDGVIDRRNAVADSSRKSIEGTLILALIVSLQHTRVSRSHEKRWQFGAHVPHTHYFFRVRLDQLCVGTMMIGRFRALLGHRLSCTSGWVEAREVDDGTRGVGILHACCTSHQLVLRDMEDLKHRIHPLVGGNLYPADAIERKKLSTAQQTSSAGSIRVGNQSWADVCMQFVAAYCKEHKNEGN